MTTLDAVTGAGKPWYLQVAFTGAAFPFQVPEEFQELYGENNPRRKHRPQQSSGDGEIRKGMVSAVDAAIGQIVDRLKKTEDWNNTVIIFLSVHGSSFEEANAPFTGSRGTLGEGGVRVPALVASPLLGPGAGGAVLED